VPTVVGGWGGGGFVESVWGAIVGVQGSLVDNENVTLPPHPRTHSTAQDEGGGGGLSCRGLEGPCVDVG